MTLMLIYLDPAGLNIISWWTWTGKDTKNVQHACAMIIKIQLCLLYEFALQYNCLMCIIMIQIMVCVCVCYREESTVITMAQ